MLSLTPKQISDRGALTINPAKTCQPIGAMYAALGIHRCLPHSHGSQGCCAYHRSHLTRHYKEPVMASTSSFTEGAAVFGGMSNLRQAITNIFHIYDPDVIAVHTTCLSETIGDDLPTIIQKAKDEGLVPDGKWVIHCNTPSYAGSHVTGFSNMTAGIVKYFAEHSERTQDQVNIIPGYVEPADMREIKRLLAKMYLPAVVFPDTSDVLDAPYIEKAGMYPKGGVMIKDLRSIGSSRMTLALGPCASENAAIELENRTEIPVRILDLPIGIAATDRFIQALLEAAETQEPPASIADDRGRMLDIMIDMQQYFYDCKVAIYG
ncbi:MAG: nitrogenase component 1, partial [bacterium]